MSVAAVRVPRHLRRFVVEQDYAQYSAIDQAVWRFVLLQAYAHLKHAAHRAYREGLVATGISIERIPRISEMNERLAQFGWGAVAVDGFIPPRAFQEFQAAGILPIAAEIRTSEHLVYTPAPDIIHEAAGHAPILPDPIFASYLRRIGALAGQAFTLPEEDRTFRAIHMLSEVKEDVGASPEAIAFAQGELRQAMAAAPEPSEATRLARLYWWTAEYGLVGRVDEYKLYGAGLLSSLGESHSCQDPAVHKLPLDEHCVDVAYDITRPQPQLFVSADFERLHEVLDRVAGTLGVRIGGAVALERAIRSAGVGTIVFSSGASVIGVVRSAGPELLDPAWLEVGGSIAFAWEGRMRDGGPAMSARPSHYVVLGAFEGGLSPERASDMNLASFADEATGRHSFRFASGARVEGRLLQARRTDGRLMYVDLQDVQLFLPGREPHSLPEYRLLAAGELRTAHAGAIDPDYYPDLPQTPIVVPKPRVRPERDRSLLDHFDRAQGAHVAGPSAIARTFAEIHDVLVRDYPREWLLRWNMLESLLRSGPEGSLARRLRLELEDLEIAFDHREPIASGLRYLDRREAAESRVSPRRSV
jgi:phenylalanine-4-hydroxylase